MKRSILLTIFAGVLILGLTVFAWVHRADMPLVSPHGPIALQERGVIGITLMMASIVVIPVFVLLFVFAVRYRTDNPKARLDHFPNWDHDNLFAEFLWWLVPAVIVLFLSGIAWQSSHTLDPYLPIKSDTAPVVVQVIALDWKWLFIYPDYGVATVNELEIPENTPIHFELTADAPMNSFWIPALSGQIMVMPGMTTQLNLQASDLGTFMGQSANISGKGFSGMTFETKSVSASDFAAWVATTRASASPLTPVTYAELAKPSEYVPPRTYAPVDSQLYTSTIMSYMMPH